MKLLKGYENGNHIVRIFDDGTKIKETGHFEEVCLPGKKGGYKKWVPSDEDHFTYDFPENADIKITDYCDAGCAYCHENSTIKGVHGDLRRIEKTLDSLHAGTEMAVGGGNALAHPDLIWFLEKLKWRCRGYRRPTPYRSRRSCCRGCSCTYRPQRPGTDRARRPPYRRGDCAVRRWYRSR